MSAIEQMPGDEPTGEIAYPFVLVEGDESAGKTTGALALARHPRINNTWALELGESKLDQYKRIAPYRILRHNGTYTEIRNQFQAAITYSRAHPPQDDKVDLIVFDGGTSLWDLEKRRVHERALRAAKAKAKKNNFHFDPDQPIDRGFHLWADARERWYGIVNLLREWEGIVVITARGKESVALDDSGRPIPDQVDWKVQTEGNLKFEVDAWIRMRRPHTATLVGCKALDVDVPADGILLEEGNIKDRKWYGPVAPVIFDMIGAGVDKFTKSTHVYGSVGRTVKEAKDYVYDKMMRACDNDEQRAKAEASSIWKASKLPAEGEINDETFTALCASIADKVCELIQSPTATATPLQVVQEPQEAVTSASTPDAPAEPPEADSEAYGEVPDDPDPALERTPFVSMSSEFSRLTPDNQEVALKWLRDSYACGPMAVKRELTETVQAYLDELQPPPPPFTDADCTLARKTSKSEQEQLQKLLRQGGLTGPNRFAFLTGVVGRKVTTLESLRLNEWEQATKAVNDRLAQQAALAS